MRKPKQKLSRYLLHFNTPWLSRKDSLMPFHIGTTFIPPKGFLLNKTKYYKRNSLIEIMVNFQHIMIQTRTFMKFMIICDFL
jgi:hypothetical protein